MVTPKEDLPLQAATAAIDISPEMGVQIFGDIGRHRPVRKIRDRLFARAQLTRLDHYLQVQREHAALLNERLAGLDGLILPMMPPCHEHSWYNYICRLDLDTLGFNGNAPLMRQCRERRRLRSEAIRRGPEAH